MEFETIIGLEVHAQLLTDTKIFCGCSTKFGAAPNSHTCPVCLGMPGVLPVLNKKVVEFAMKMSLATNCAINKSCSFAARIISIPTCPKVIRYLNMLILWLSMVMFFWTSTEFKRKSDLPVFTWKKMPVN